MVSDAHLIAFIEVLNKLTARKHDMCDNCHTRQASPLTRFGTETWCRDCYWNYVKTPEMRNSGMTIDFYPPATHSCAHYPLGIFNAWDDVLCIKCDQQPPLGRTNPGTRKQYSMGSHVFALSQRFCQTCVDIIESKSILLTVTDSLTLSPFNITKAVRGAEILISLEIYRDEDGESLSMLLPRLPQNFWLFHRFQCPHGEGPSMQRVASPSI